MERQEGFEAVAVAVAGDSSHESIGRARLGVYNASSGSPVPTNVINLNGLEGDVGWMLQVPFSNLSSEWLAYVSHCNRME